jgi:hypothetical protein
MAVENHENFEIRGLNPICWWIVQIRKHTFIEADSPGHQYQDLPSDQYQDHQE